MALEDVSTLAAFGTTAQIAIVETVAGGGPGGDAGGSCPFLASTLGGALGGVVGGAVGGVIGSVVGSFAKEVGTRCLKRRRTDTGEADDAARRVDDLVHARMSDVQSTLQLQLLEMMKTNAALIKEMKKSIRPKVRKIEKKVHKLDKALSSQQRMLNDLKDGKASVEQVEECHQLLQGNVDQLDTISSTLPDTSAIERMEDTLKSLQESLQEKADTKELEAFQKSWTQERFYQGKASFNQLQMVQRGVDELTRKADSVTKDVESKAGMADVQKFLNSKFEIVADLMEQLITNNDQISNEVAAVKLQALDIYPASQASHMDVPSSSLRRPREHAGTPRPQAGARAIPPEPLVKRKHERGPVCDRVLHFTMQGPARLRHGSDELPPRQDHASVHRYPEFDAAVYSVTGAATNVLASFTRLAAGPLSP
eukprot:CAMPEP_0179332440 /NCGR_PEP_ID=MMETSP0797-20121207/64734_1 /TAXON_ID=47934 /ORGANISM="Dinophysis acuminata, Strain DAEP01" /LENGTH=424 /DNA_ID=CAMNT_0021045307 /DNA_START=76 /DNA_END=1348 /DNA_ORIENTATION=+